MVAHCTSTLVFDVTMVGPAIPKSRHRHLNAPVFPGFNVVRELASGGMGVVYEAFHRATGARVAIKTMRNDRPELGSSHGDLKRRFLGELIASQRIDHPAVVHVIDYGRDGNGSPFLVMEFLEGESLAERVKRAPLTPTQFCDIAEQLVSVLAAAHRAGILHRDIKPANIIVSDDPAEPGHLRIKLIDFGIAKFVTEDELAADRTAAGLLVGTPAYMSPEQCLGATLDERSDIYSTGCLFYELLANRCPFLGSVGGVLTAHRHSTPVPIATRNPAVPARLAALVDRMLEKSAPLRPASMDEVERELALLEEERRGRAPRTSQSYAAIPRRIVGEPSRRSRFRARAAGALFAAALSAAAAAVMLTQL